MNPFFKRIILQAATILGKSAFKAYKESSKSTFNFNQRTGTSIKCQPIYIIFQSGIAASQPRPSAHELVRRNKDPQFGEQGAHSRSHNKSIPHFNRILKLILTEMINNREDPFTYSPYSTMPRTASWNRTHPEPNKK